MLISLKKCENTGLVALLLVFELQEDQLATLLQTLAMTRLWGVAICMCKNGVVLKKLRLIYFFLFFWWHTRRT